MKNILLISLCISMSACANYGYEQKLNVVEDKPDELAVTPPTDCPNWREPVEGDSYNHPHTNLGCATITNYGAMLTNPRDMLKGRGSDAADSERSRLYVHGYNSGAPLDGSTTGTSAASTTTSSASSGQ